MQVRWPIACATWLLPTPVLPISSTLSWRAMKLVVARSMTLCRGIFGLKPKSKSSKVLLPSKFALRRRGRLLAVAAFDLVVQESVEEFFEGEPIVDGLAAA